MSDQSQPSPEEAADLDAIERENRLLRDKKLGDPLADKVMAAWRSFREGRPANTAHAEWVAFCAGAFAAWPSQPSAPTAASPAGKATAEQIEAALRAKADVIHGHIAPARRYTFDDWDRRGMQAAINAALAAVSPVQETKEEAR